MKIVTASNGKKKVKISKSEWQSIGKKAGWMKLAISIEPNDNSISEKTRKSLTDLARHAIHALEEWVGNGGNANEPQYRKYVKIIMESDRIKEYLYLTDMEKLDLQDLINDMNDPNNPYINPV